MYNCSKKENSTLKKENKINVKVVKIKKIENLFSRDKYSLFNYIDLRNDKLLFYND